MTHHCHPCARDGNDRNSLDHCHGNQDPTLLALTGRWKASSCAVSLPMAAIPAAVPKSRMPPAAGGRDQDRAEDRLHLKLHAVVD
ncbi:hypothetical protein [Pseudoxanthomonas sangjuensis]|uniref:hypothetical protein n=1 Tax=Pseudoxanthomonas sangjuensis TaxID=1503750 RepID=UPI00139102BB|nr:hypothetical protein [Pseudoxanthomonas sangjuensis]